MCVQAIGNAAAILTDPEKRKQYDVRGEEPAHTPHAHHQYYARGFESDLTAEELFNMFFGATGTTTNINTAFSNVSTFVSIKQELGVCVFQSHFWHHISEVDLDIYYYIV